MDESKQPDSTAPEKPEFNEAQNMPQNPDELIAQSKKPAEEFVPATGEIDPATILGKEKLKGPKSKIPVIGGVIVFVKGGGMVRKFAFVMAVIVVVLLITSIIVSISRPSGPVVVGTPAPTARPIVTPSPEPNVEAPIVNPSVYAQDPEVLSLKDEIEKMDDLLLEVNFKEEFLRVPDLEWEVRFD